MNKFALASTLVKRQLRKAALPTRSGGHPTGTPDPKYGGFRMPVVNQWHKIGSEVMGTTMWFWMFYRAYHDLPSLLGAHPFLDEHH